MAEAVEHVVVEAPADPDPAVATAAIGAVAAAESAAALAHSTAAAAELQAAELVQDTAQEVDEWRTQTESRLANYSEQLNSLTSLEAERHSALNSAIERLEALELLLLAKEEEEAAEEASESPTASTQPTSTQEEGESPILGGETVVTAGPIEAEAGASLAGSGDQSHETNPSQNPPPSRRRRRWI